MQDEKLDVTLTTKEDMAKAVLLLALKSRADFAIIPIQDILLLDSRYRMNIPSTTGGNWQFKLKKISANDYINLRKYCEITDRLNFI